MASWHRPSSAPRTVRLGLLVFLGALVIVGCSGDDDASEGASPHQDASGTTDGTLAWFDCREDLADILGFDEVDVELPELVECELIEVPLDWDLPDGEHIEVAMARLPATGDDPIGPLFYNPGGPGGSGIEDVLETEWPEELREHFDIVGFDPRGVGLSEPLECGLELVDPEVPDAAEYEEFNEELLADCETEHGEVLFHLGTDAVVEDLDAMRAAMGGEQLSYLGISYGTLIGALYADAYPERVRAMVLDGNIDPSLPLRDSLRQHALAYEQAVDAFLSWCTAAVDECELASIGDPETALVETMATLGAGLLELDGAPIDPADVAAFVGLTLYGGESTYPLVDLALASLARGDVDGYLVALMLEEELTDDLDDDDIEDLIDELFEELEAFGDDPDGLEDLDGELVGMDNSTLALWAVTCADYNPGWDAQQAQAVIEEIAEAAPRVGFTIGFLAAECLGWPGPVAERAPVRAAGAPPILLINSANDPATPLEAAEALAEQFESAVLVVYEGGLHGISLARESTCIEDLVVDYLVALELPDDGLACPLEA